MQEDIRSGLAAWANTLSELGPALAAGAPGDALATFRERYSSLFQRQFPQPTGVRYEACDLGGVASMCATPEELKTDAVLMYIHGGAYIFGGGKGYWGIAGHYARLLGARVFLPDYRLAPEHPFPAAIDDTLTAYRALLDQGIAAHRIVFAGESAGGAMVVSVMVAAKHAGFPLPAAGTAISPWANLEHTGESMVSRDGLDPICDKVGLTMLSRVFLGGAVPNHPMASPVNADVSGLPPVQIQVGENEVMLSDAMRLATHLADNGVRLNLEVWPGMFHAWHFFGATMPEGMQAMQNSARFLEQQLDQGGPR